MSPNIVVQAIIKERIMQKNLVIVESPAKAKTIEKFLGKDFKVLSSYGHIRDLKKKEFSIDVEKNFTPSYEIPADKKALVSTLKAEAKEAETVWLASDEDREGEAISWHLAEVLKLPVTDKHRIVFHEITKSAIAANAPQETRVAASNATTRNAEPVTTSLRRTGRLTVNSKSLFALATLKTLNIARKI